MSDFEFCIRTNQQQGKITKALADQILAADDPETEINRLVGQLTREKREAALQATRMAQGFEWIQAHPKSQYDGLMSLLTRDQTGQANNPNIEYLTKVWQGRWHSQFAEALSRFRTRRLGFEQDQEGLNKFIRAVYGEQVDDPEIMRFAQDWTKMTEEIRTTFNQKGGSIPKNEKWLLPQGHNARAIEKVPVTEWKNFVRNKLDREQMTDDLGQPLNDQQFEEALDFVYETITTNGLNKVPDFSVPRLGKKLARRGSERRFLYFKDAEGWMDYQKRFGKGDIFTALTDFIDTKSNDLALLEMMGPSPDTTFKALRTQVDKTSKLTNRQKAFSNAVWNVVSGRTSEGELTGLADFFQTTRNLLTASTLGKAFLSAISDTGFSAITSKYNGIPAHRVLTQQLSQLNPKNEKDRIFAVKLGLIADSWVERASAANRYADVYGTGASAKLAEGVLRGSMLTAWTDAGRKAFGMEFSSMLADNFGKSVSELDPAVQRAFETYGITEKDWNTFRRSKALDFKGAKFADVTKKGGQKFHNMILSETDFAVPTPNATVRAITTGGMGRATVAGQGWRSIMMLKSFPITIATSHFYRAAYQATTADKLAYLGALVASTTVLGGVALQAKDISAGREPRPTGISADGIDPELFAKYFAASFQQGGGLGIFGDFLFSDVNRFGGGIVETAFGPTGELVDETFKFTLGNLREAVQGEETNVLGEAAQILKRYNPDVWQTQVFTDALFDQIEMMGNPDAQRRFNRIVKKRQADYDQGYWWRPGEALPELAR